MMVFLKRPMKYYLLLYLLFLCELLSAQVHLPCTRFYTDRPVWTYLGPVNDSASSGTQRFGASKSLSVNPSDSNEIFWVRIHPDYSIPSIVAKIGNASLIDSLWR
ncbi:MAG: hypothetical protein HWD58_00780 [Bacteroidota bacterium]|nr:MAG: hypothetical protein HWD58_00780 [Bacteroidota bacterium]